MNYPRRYRYRYTARDWATVAAAVLALAGWGFACWRWAHAI